MPKIITMYAGDREILRCTGHVLQLAIQNLDSVSDGGNSLETRDILAECIRQIEDVKSKLRKIDVKAITYQLSPGQEMPR